MPYSLDETIAAGDLGHQDHHSAIAAAVNNMDVRITTVEGKAAVIHVDDIADVDPGDYPVDTLIVQRTA